MNEFQAVAFVLDLAAVFAGQMYFTIKFFWSKEGRALSFIGWVVCNIYIDTLPLERGKEAGQVIAKMIKGR